MWLFQASNKPIQSSNLPVWYDNEMSYLSVSTLPMHSVWMTGRKVDVLPYLSVLVAQKWKRKCSLLTSITILLIVFLLSYEWDIRSLDMVSNDNNAMHAPYTAPEHVTEQLANSLAQSKHSS